MVPAAFGCLMHGQPCDRVKWVSAEQTGSPSWTASQLCSTSQRVVRHSFPMIFQLQLQPVPDGRDGDGRDPYYRLRGALKRLLRSYGLRCVECKEIPAADLFIRPNQPDHKGLRRRPNRPAKSRPDNDGLPLWAACQ